MLSAGKENTVTVSVIIYFLSSEAINSAVHVSHGILTSLYRVVLTGRERKMFINRKKKLGIDQINVLSFCKK